MTAIDAGGSRQWTVGSVLSMSFSVFTGHLVPFAGTALLLTVPTLLFRLVLPLSFFQNIVQIAFGQIAYVTLIYGTVQALRGRKVAMGECLSEGFKRLGVAFVVGILYTIALAVGFVLLIVPGVLVLLWWAVAVPSAVVEKTGVADSFSRSSALTRDRRWRILGVLLVAGLIVGVIQFIIFWIIGLMAGSTVTTLVLQHTSLFGLVQWLVGGVALAFYACLLATLYYSLRSDKEGVDINQIASVFD
ncbi:MAG TPA: hypothetical protein VMI56_26865 [Reyranella sp.]|nr:hypothetical protein [Reyranella sp.]